MRNPGLSRRGVTGGLGAVLLASKVLAPGAAGAQGALLKRPIPHGNGETLPAIGLGTAGVFDVGGAPQEHAGPAAAVAALLAAGGSLIDTAPSYGNAENVVGDILAASNARSHAFIATKLEEYRPGKEAAEAQGSLQRLKTGK